MPDYCYISPLGPMTLGVEGNKICSISLPQEPGSHFKGKVSPVLPGDFERLMQDFFILKDKFKLPLSFFNFDAVSPFSKKVLTVLASQVPYGKVISYGKLAELVHSPGASRAVGSVMAINPFPLLIPCHRVVCSDRRVGGFQGGPAGTLLKRRLLDFEKIRFDKKGRILADHFV